MQYIVYCYPATPVPSLCSQVQQLAWDLRQDTNFLLEPHHAICPGQPCTNTVAKLQIGSIFAIGVILQVFDFTPSIVAGTHRKIRPELKLSIDAVHSDFSIKRWNQRWIRQKLIAVSQCFSILRIGPPVHSVHSCQSCRHLLHVVFDCCSVAGVEAAACEM